MLLLDTHVFYGLKTKIAAFLMRFWKGSNGKEMFLSVLFLFGK